MDGVGVNVMGNVRLLVLEFPRMAVAVADVHTDCDAAFCAGLGEVFEAGRKVFCVGACEVEECFVAGAEEGEDGLLAEDSGFVGVLKSVLEGAAEGPQGC